MSDIGGDGFRDECDVFGIWSHTDPAALVALGHAKRSGIPYELEIRNHHVGRTFVEPTEHVRHLELRPKHDPDRAVRNGGEADAKLSLRTRVA